MVLKCARVHSLHTSCVEQTLQACDGVAAEAPTDEQVLNILSMVYKGSEHVNKLIAAYEDAVKARPQDAHLLQTLLFTQTRYKPHPWVRQCNSEVHLLSQHSIVRASSWPYSGLPG